MRLEKLLLILFVILFFSCQSDKKDNVENVFCIDIKQKSELSSILEGDYIYTILETCEKSLIGEISKIELTEDRIYILDRRRGKAIIIFDKAGNFINRIEKYGQGPGEYVALTDMGILNSNIFILARDRIIVYSEDGTWIKTIRLDTHYSYFHLIDERYLILYSGKSNLTMYDFTLFDYINDSIIERFLPYKNAGGYIPYNSPFYKTDSNELFISNEYDYNIYSFADNNLIPRYTLKFNTIDQIPKNHKNISKIELHDQLATSNVFTRIKCMNKSEDFIVLTFPLFHNEWGIRTHFALIDCQTSETKHIRLGDIIDTAFPYFDEPMLIKNGQLTCPVETHRLINLENILSLSYFKDKLSIEDNPVLFFYKLKHW